MLSHGTPWVNLDVVGPEIAALQARVAELEAAREWRDIATAPTDGKPVIVALIRRGRVWRVSDAYFNGLAWYTIEGGEGVSWATHWMPLPQPPKEDK